MDFKQIYRLRKERLKLSQERFAQLVLVSSKTVSRWEKNDSAPSGLVLQRLQKLDIITSDKTAYKDLLSAISLGINSDEIDFLIAKHYPRCKKLKMKGSLG